MAETTEPNRYAFLTDAAPTDAGGHGCHVLAQQWLTAMGTASVLVVTHPAPRKIHGRTKTIHAGRQVCSYTTAPPRLYSRLPMLTLALLIGQLPKISRQISASGATRLFALCGADFWYLASVWLIQIAARLPLDIYLVDDMEESAQLQHKLSPRWFIRALEKYVLRRAARVYGISPGLAAHLSRKYDVSAQWLPIPITETPALYHPCLDAHSKVRTIVFAGAVNPLYASTLRELLAQIEAWNGNPAPFKIQLQILSYTPAKEIHQWIGDSPSLQVKVGLADDDLRRHLNASWAVFLPYSFDEAQRIMVSTSFSLKFKDAMTSGRPVLVFGPAYGSLPAYFLAESLPLCVTSAGGLAKSLNEIETLDGPELISKYHALLLRNHSPTSLSQRLTISPSPFKKNAS